MTQNYAIEQLDAALADLVMLEDAYVGKGYDASSESVEWFNPAKQIHQMHPLIIETLVNIHPGIKTFVARLNQKIVEFNMRVMYRYNDLNQYHYLILKEFYKENKELSVVEYWDKLKIDRERVHGLLSYAMFLYDTTKNIHLFIGGPSVVGSIGYAIDNLKKVIGEVRQMFEDGTLPITTSKA